MQAKTEKLTEESISSFNTRVHTVSKSFPPSFKGPATRQPAQPAAQKCVLALQYYTVLRFGCHGMRTSDVTKGTTP